MERDEVSTSSRIHVYIGVYIILMRRDEVSTSFRIHLSAVLQQFCSLLTAVSLFSLLASHIYWRTWLSLSLQMH